MSKKKTKEIKEKRKAKKLKQLEKLDRVVKGVVIPEGALKANPDMQQPAGYSTKYYYKDKYYCCAGCGSDQVWTAEQQKRYYEEQYGNIYNEPKWCTDCHRKRMESKYGKEE